MSDERDVAAFTFRIDDNRCTITHIVYDDDPPAIMDRLVESIREGDKARGIDLCKQLILSLGRERA